MELDRNEKQSGPPPKWFKLIEMCDLIDWKISPWDVDRTYTKLQWFYRLVEARRIQRYVAAKRAGDA